MTPDGRRLYVINAATNAVLVIDTAGETVTNTFMVADNPSDVAVNPDGRRVFVTTPKSTPCR